MYTITNISNQVVVLIQAINGLKEIYLEPNDSVVLSNLSEFVNLSNLLDPSMKILKIRKDV